LCEKKPLDDVFLDVIYLIAWYILF